MDGGLDVPSAALTRFKAGVRAACVLTPGSYELVAAPQGVGDAGEDTEGHRWRRQQFGSRLRLAKPTIELAQKLATRRSLRGDTWPSSRGRSRPSRERPASRQASPRLRLPPERSPPEIGVVDLTLPVRRLVAVALQRDPSKLDLLLQLCVRIPFRRWFASPQVDRPSF